MSEREFEFVGPAASSGRGRRLANCGEDGLFSRRETKNREFDFHHRQFVTVMKEDNLMYD